MSFRLANVRLSYAKGRAVLSRLTLEAARAERVAIIGASGAGKTSLLRLLGAARRPDDGSVEVLQHNPWRLSPRELRRLRSRIGVVHQHPPIPPRQRAVTAILAGRLGTWPWWKAAASLLYPADIAGAEAELARLDLADRLFERCDRLSGGQLQRVGVAGQMLYFELSLLHQPRACTVIIAMLVLAAIVDGTSAVLRNRLAAA
jgi:phosphonate transport system ATP-binding protein